MKRRLGPITALRSLARLLRGRPHVPPSLANNELLNVILHRRSVRSFTAQPIPDDVFAAILEAGRLAPSTVNLQTWAFAVFDADLWRQTFGRAIPMRGVRAVIVISDTYRDRMVLDEFSPYPLVNHTVGVMNASLAAMNMNVAAEALGVASVMLSETGRSGLLDVKYLKEKLGLPAGAVPLMTIVFGYARGPYPPMPPKLPAEQVFFEGKYRPPDPATMESWMDQMKAGYKASHLTSSFQAQVNVYRGKIGQAENDLREMVLGPESALPSRFDRQAASWDTPYRAERARAISAEIREQVRFSPQDRILEFGSGTGLVGFNLVDSVASLTLVDSSEGMLAAAKEKIPGQAHGKPVTIQKDVFSKDLPEGGFDCIFTSLVLHHIQDVPEIGKRFTELLKENGVLCVVDLMPDDGSFHLNEPDFDGHNGFDPVALSAEFERLGFAELSRRVFYTNTKEAGGRQVDYALFSLVMKNRAPQKGKSAEG